jgi:hypothetical protein
MYQPMGIEYYIPDSDHEETEKDYEDFLRKENKQMKKDDKNNENTCPCGNEMQPGIDYCSEECCVKYACDDNEDALVWIGNGIYIDEYDNEYRIEC